MAREKGMGSLQMEKSGRWTMRVCIDGKRYSRSTRTRDREQAERFLQRFLAPLGLGERRLPLADVWNAYVVSPNRNELAPATLNSKRVVWMHFAKWMERNYLPVGDLAGVTAEMIAEYLALLRANLCGSSYNGRVCVLREMFRTLATKAGLEDDPWEGVRLRPDDSHSRRELTMEELRRLISAAKSVPSASRRPALASGGAVTAPVAEDGDGTVTNEWHKLFLIGIYTGLRLGDCCRLDWSQINLAAGVIQIVPRKTRRHHQRLVTIPIHPALGASLLDRGKVVDVSRSRTKEDSNIHCTPTTPRIAPAAQLASLGGYSDYNLFSGPVLPMISEMYGRARWRVSHELAKIFRAAGITTSVWIEGRRHRTPEATFHSLRHTFVSFAANAGVPLHIVQSIVGHESTAMTRHYYHENIDALKSAVAAIPAL